MRVSEEYKRTSNRAVYNRARKWILESKGEISCAHCRYHKGENGDYSYNSPTCWKKSRKTQYKCRDVAQR